MGRRHALGVYVQAMVGCLTCFPLFACLTTRYMAVGAIICILYSLLWLSLSVVDVLQALEGNSTLLGIQVAFSEYTAVSMTYAYAVMQGLPIIYCYVVLIGYCFYILKRCYTSKTYFSQGLEITVRPHQEEHVKWVLRKFQLKKSQKSDSIKKEYLINRTSQTFVEQMNSSIKLKYFTNFPFFKYPTRIIALAFVQLNVLYWIGLLLATSIVIILYLMYHAEFTKIDINSFEFDLVIIISVCSSFSLLMSVFNYLVQIFIGFRNYRFDILRIYQGNKTFVPVLKQSSQYILTRSMTFAGFQIAFMMWGIVLCFAVVLLLTLIPALLIYFFVQFNILDDICLLLLQTLSFPATVLLAFYLQMFVTKVVLLQNKMKATDKGPPLNVDNRKLYELLNYYSLFTNLAVGIFTCLWRICESAFIGTLSVGRLDRSVFTRDLETADTGYTAYASMLLVDNAHNNPCVRVFTHLLWTKALAARLKQFQSQEEMSQHTPLIVEDYSRYKSIGVTAHTPEGPCSPDNEGNPWAFCEISGTCTPRKTSIRWHLAYTLINNPQFCKLRKHRLAKDLCKASSLVNDTKGIDSLA